MDRAGEHSKQVELTGMVVSKPRLVDDTDWLIRVESYHGWHEVILKQTKRWLKPGIMIKVSGFMKDNTLLAYHCERYRGKHRGKI